MTFAVVLSGGLVQDIITDDPKEVGTEFIVIDYDTDGADDSDLDRIDFLDGDDALAYVHLTWAERSNIKIATLVDNIKAESRDRHFNFKEQESKQ